MDNFSNSLNSVSELMQNRLGFIAQKSTHKAPGTDREIRMFSYAVHPHDFYYVSTDIGSAEHYELIGYRNISLDEKILGYDPYISISLRGLQLDVMIMANKGLVPALGELADVHLSEYMPYLKKDGKGLFISHNLTLQMDTGEQLLPLRNFLYEYLASVR